MFPNLLFFTADDAGYYDLFVLVFGSDNCIPSIDITVDVFANNLFFYCVRFCSFLPSLRFLHEHIIWAHAEASILTFIYLIL